MILVDLLKKISFYEIYEVNIIELKNLEIKKRKPKNIDQILIKQ